ncbi:MAG: methyltransferase domain-containing protein [Anaerolineae bacterium]
MSPTEHPQFESPPPICDYEGSSYRTDFWEDQGRDYEDLAERHALRKLLPDAGSRLLDIGAGFGRLADLYDGYGHVILLDYSVSQLQYARQRLGDTRFTYVAADLYQLPLATNAVDVTVMVRVLHHITDVSRALSQIRRATRGDGAFVLEFANKRHALNIVRHILGSDMNPFDHQPYAFAELHYDYHPAWVREQLKEAGFQPQRERAVSSFRMATLKRLVPAKVLARLDAALQAVTAPLAIAPSQFVRSRVAKASGPLAVDILACPRCGYHPLEESDTSIHCPRCRVRWAIDQGVYVFKRPLDGSP